MAVLKGSKDDDESVFWRNGLFVTQLLFLGAYVRMSSKKVAEVVLKVSGSDTFHISCQPGAGLTWYSLL